MLEAARRYITLTLLGLIPGTQLANAVKLFIYDILKIFLPLAVITFAVSVVSRYFPPEPRKHIVSYKKAFIAGRT